MKTLICSQCGIATLHLIADGLKSGVCQSCHAGRGLMLPAVASGTPTLDVIHHADALTLLRALPDKSIDAIITDMPYGTTQAKWDSVIDLFSWWEQVQRILKHGGVMVSTASQPFTSRLVMSNPAWFRYEWIWSKSNATGFLDAPYKPMKAHESILVFCETRGAYYPQMTRGKRHKRGFRSRVKSNQIYGSFNDTVYFSNDYFPRSVVWFYEPELHSARKTYVSHDTQKPVALYEYLIQTYTRPGELVLDPFVGSGTTAIAARKTGRHFICGDSSADYVAMARKRLASTDPFLSREVAPGLVQKSLFEGVGLCSSNIPGRQ